MELATPFQFKSKGPPVKKRKANNISDGVKEAGSGKDLVVPRNIPPVGYNNTYTVTLKYVDFYQVVVDATTSRHQIWTPFNLYDPDYSNVGHQPQFRDMWASMYDYYTVLTVDYDITVCNNSQDTIAYTAVGSNNQRRTHCSTALLCTTNDSDISAPSGPYPMSEMKNVQTQFLPCGSGGAIPMVNFKGSLTPQDWMVDAKDSDSDTTFTAIGNSPALNRYLGVKISPCWSAAAGQNETEYAACTIFAQFRITTQFTQVNATLRQASS